ncbi:translation initiation factor IF-2 [Cavia porcellus]|uniref:translation initiation factor IF-2 n=1 Tax=Cavia porcellus TaxID=10141 RepID=UPI002FE3E841
MASAAAARADDTSPRRGRPGTAGGGAGGARRILPAAGRPRTTNPPAPTPPGAGSGSGCGAEGPSAPGRRRRARLSPSAAPASQGVYGCGPAQPAGSGRGRPPAPPLAGDAPAPRVEAHNGHQGGPLCARTDKPQPTRRARAQAREQANHPARSPPLLPSLAPPSRPARRARGRGPGEAAPTCAALGAGRGFPWLNCGDAIKELWAARGAQLLAAGLGKSLEKTLFSCQQSSRQHWKNERKSRRVW